MQPSKKFAFDVGITFLASVVTLPLGFIITILLKDTLEPVIWDCIEWHQRFTELQCLLLQLAFPRRW